ncbi:MAG: dinitrogenase iron-molybdenum cofactor biosynthesis protein [Crenarchaeota archaeon]|nr:dinitrogenase iron-molybdenum cofactor biosynthesis protein [Thermoproteota archaeon]
MRVAVLAEGPEGPVSFRFGRAPYVLIFEDGKLVKAVPNPAALAPSHPGPALAAFLKKEGVDLLIGPMPGPTTAMILERMGIKVVEGEPGSGVEEALRRALGWG